MGLPSRIENRIHSVPSVYNWQTRPGMVAGGVKCVVWTVVCVTVVGGFHAHHPFSRPQDTHHGKEWLPGPAQADSGAETPEPKAKGQQGSSRERLRRWVSCNSPSRL